MLSNGDIDVLTAGPTTGLAFRRRTKLTLSCRTMSEECKIFTAPFTVPVVTVKRPTLPLLSNAVRIRSKRSLRTIFPSELASKLEGNRDGIMLIDCRPSLAFQMNHIRGAVNLCCSGKLIRKRIQLGKVKLVDLIQSCDEKSLFRSWKGQDIVLYDEHTRDIDMKPCENAFYMILHQLIKEYRDQDVVYLTGGLSEFRRGYGHLCDTSITIQEHRPLYSPTTPIIDSEIETATASRILPFLFIGNERDAANLQRLEELNISYLLNVTSHIPFYFENAGIKCKRLPATDCGQQNLKQYFADAIEFIEMARRANASILIHCQAGVSRSATITIAYLLKHSSLSLTQAYSFVKAHRPIISPNLNFMGQLLDFEQKLNDGSVERCPMFEL